MSKHRSQGLHTNDNCWQPGWYDGRIVCLTYTEHKAHHASRITQLASWLASSRPAGHPPVHVSRGMDVRHRRC